MLFSSELRSWGESKEGSRERNEREQQGLTWKGGGSLGIEYDNKLTNCYGELFLLRQRKKNCRILNSAKSLEATSVGDEKSSVC